MTTLLNRKNEEKGVALREPFELPFWGTAFPYMRRLTEEIDRAFGFKPGFLGLTEPYLCGWSPDIEIFEHDNTFFVRADLPGLTKENVKVQVIHDELTIEGERKLEKEETKEGFYRTERTYGAFYRRIPLPEYVKAEAARATFKNGVLEVEIPTIPVPEVKKRTVEIQG
jgi:HSP20 family protein